MYTIEIDMRQAFAKLGLAFEEYAKQVREKALYRALNDGFSDVMVTQLKRILVKQTGLPYSKTSGAITLRKAHAGRLEVRITAKDTYHRLSEFGLRGALGKNKKISAAPWGRRQTFRNTWIMPVSKGGALEAFKRVDGKARVLWGPNISREMIRPGRESLTSIETARMDVFLKRIPHHLSLAVAEAKAKSGT